MADILKIHPLVSQNSSFLSEETKKKKKKNSQKQNKKWTNKKIYRYVSVVYYTTIISSSMKTEQKYGRWEILEKEVDIFEFLFRSILKF